MVGREDHVVPLRFTGALQVGFELVLARLELILAGEALHLHDPPLASLKDQKVHPTASFGNLGKDVSSKESGEGGEKGVEVVVVHAFEDFAPGEDDVASLQNVGGIAVEHLFHPEGSRRIEIVPNALKGILEAFPLAVLEGLEGGVEALLVDGNGNDALVLLADLDDAVGLEKGDPVVVHGELHGAVEEDAPQDLRVLFRLVHHVGDVLVRVVPEEVVEGAEEECFRDGFASGGLFLHQVPGEGVHQAGLSRGVAPDTAAHLRVEGLPRLPGVLKQKVLGLLPGEVICSAMLKGLAVLWRIPVIFDTPTRMTLRRRNSSRT